LNTRYPTDFTSLAVWAAANGFTQEEARRRYAQYLVLTSISIIRALRDALVFKGGNALDFVWNSNRSTLDLDFSIDHDAPGEELTGERLRALLVRGVATIARRHGVALEVHGLDPNPKKPGHTFVTYQGTIGYALPDQQTLQQRLARGMRSTQIVKIEISLNEPICQATTIALNAGEPPLRISTPEDIVAEKLRALLQQSIRNRERPQDVLDISAYLQTHPELDRATIAEYLTIKAAARNVPISKAAFHHPEIAARASRDYEQLRTTARDTFIPFDDAFATILGFIDSLPIPDTDPNTM
jgi:predicted nucleotidyltransferase component of viral defense system